MNNAPAFPTHHANYSTGSHCGMTLRDYFAAAAMKGLLSGGTDRIKTDKDVLQLAPVSFALADAMLKAREQ